MTTEMVEKVAEALWLEEFADSPMPRPKNWQALADWAKERYRQRARAAIRALKHPITDEMRRAGLRQVHHGNSPDQILWAMLTAALGEDHGSS